MVGKMGKVELLLSQSYEAGYAPGGSQSEEPRMCTR